MAVPLDASFAEPIGHENSLLQLATGYWSTQVPFFLTASYMASGAISSSPGQVTAPCSIRTCLKKSELFRTSKTPVKWVGKNLISPAMPSENSTCKVKSFVATTDTTGGAQGSRAKAKSPWDAVSIRIISSSPSVQRDVMRPTQVSARAHVAARCHAAIPVFRSGTAHGTQHTQHESEVGHGHPSTFLPKCHRTSRSSARQIPGGLAVCQSVACWKRCATLSRRDSVR